MRESRDKWASRGEKLLFRLIIICVATLLVSQMLLLKEGTRIYLSKVDKMEGELIASANPLQTDTPLQILEETTAVKSYQNLFRKNKVILIRMATQEKEPNVYVLVNGKKADNFSNGNSKLTVYDGDYVEIDARSLKHPVRFIINVPDKDVLSPIDGLMVEGNKSILQIGKIKFKND